MKYIICDTTFYFSPKKDIINDKTLKIIGTIWNGWELITSSKFKSQHFNFLKRAAKNFLEIPHLYIHDVPMVYNMHGQYKERSNPKSYETFTRIKMILEQIANCASYEEFENESGFISFREYDNQSRRDVEQFLRDVIIKSKSIQEDFDHELIYDIFLANFREFVHDWYNKQFGILIYRGNINIEFNSVFNQVLLAYFYELHRGAIQVGKNDFNDLMHLLYINNNKFYHTSEGNWINFMQNVDVAKEVLIL